MPLIIPLQESVHVDVDEACELVKISQKNIDGKENNVFIQGENLPELVKYLQELCEEGASE